MVFYPATTAVYLMIQLTMTLAEYKCLCVFDNYVHPIYQEANVTSNVIGYLPPNQCKYFLFPVNAEFGAIMVFHQRGYIHMQTPGMVHTCEGKPPPSDILTTPLPFSTQTTLTRHNLTVASPTNIVATLPSDMHTTARSTTATTLTTETSNSYLPFTSDSSFVSSATPSVITSSTVSTTLRTISYPATSNLRATRKTVLTSPSPTSPATESNPNTTPSTTKSTTSNVPMKTLTSTLSVPEGHIDACPEYIRNTDVNRFHGFLGQYREFCYELVDTPTQWVNAERHCAIVSKGHLVHVLNQDEQDYLVRFLSKHHYIRGVWLGLTDSGDNNIREGTWRWASGAKYHFNNFQSDYAQHSANTHKLNDCGLFKQGGEWTDANCGTSFVGFGFGESHPYICQYNVSSTLPSLLDSLPHVVVG